MTKSYNKFKSHPTLYGGLDELHQFKPEITLFKKKRFRNHILKTK